MRNAVKDGLSAVWAEHLICDLENWSGKEWQSCLRQMKATHWTPPKSARISRLSSSLGMNASATKTCRWPAGKKRGAIILAGGQGSRLGFAGPKGCFPILGKSLFAWHSEKSRPMRWPL